MQEEVLEAIRMCAVVTEFDETDTLEQLGIDSLDITQLEVDLEIEGITPDMTVSDVNDLFLA